MPTKNEDITWKICDSTDIMSVTHDKLTTTTPFEVKLEGNKKTTGFITA